MMNVRINRGAVLIIGVFVFVALIVLLYSNDNEANELYTNLRHSRQVNLRKLLIASIKASKAGGIEVVQISKSHDLQQKSKGKTKEGVDDPLTAADSRSHCVMKSGLHRLFPKVEIISEEDKTHGGCQDITSYFDLDPTVIHENVLIPDEMVNVDDVTVWIDPLDATKEYTGRN
uniref:inositol-phosphate phosphatase n=1 Tax=Megaselia scalaris TaxID=36166 RepID=T1GC83_MEGSC